MLKNGLLRLSADLAFWIIRTKCMRNKDRSAEISGRLCSSSTQTVYSNRSFSFSISCRHSVYVFAFGAIHRKPVIVHGLIWQSQPESESWQALLDSGNWYSFRHFYIISRLIRTFKLHWTHGLIPISFTTHSIQNLS